MSELGSDVQTDRVADAQAGQTPQAAKVADAVWAQGKPKRIVVKIGTSTLIDTDSRLKVAFLYDLASQVRRLRDEGMEVVVVSSGAIGVGLLRLGIHDKPDDIPTLQAAAAAGQVELAARYDAAFEHYGMQMAQVLLTRHETSDRDSYLHARDTLERLIELGIVVLINENDTISVDEIRFGDNDTLATLVATMIGADLVILLSDIEGLYTADPRKSEDAELLRHVGEVTDELYEIAGGAGSAYGSGGMITKLKAARVLMAAGIPMVICQGRRPNVVYDVATGQQVGTRFDLDEKAHHANAKKLWIALGSKLKGTIVVDPGAARALRDGGGSLLPVGVKAVEGEFEVGEPVAIRDAHGHVVGRGLARIGSQALQSVVGMNSGEIRSRGLLDGQRDPVAVHRDEMVIL